MSRNYWIDLFTGTTWREFVDAGAKVSGFRDRQRSTVEKVKPGDYLLCYVTGIGRFIAALEVTSKPYIDQTPIWKEDVFPCRLKSKPLVVLTPETAVPIQTLRDRLSIFTDAEDRPNRWKMFVRRSPAPWKPKDGEVVLQALREAEQNPVSRPVDKAKLRKRVRGISTKLGLITLPEADEAPEVREVAPTDYNDHTEIQWILAKLGNDLGLDVWIARNVSVR